MILKISSTITLVTLLVSCSSKKSANCDAYSQTLKIPYEDTIIMEPLHYHLEEEHTCVWVKSDTNVYFDTLYLEIYERR